MQCINEDEIKNLGYDLIKDDFKRIGNKTKIELDMNKAFCIFRGIVAENGRTSHDFIGTIGGYLLYKMRHKIQEHKDKKSGYRIYYVTNKDFKTFLPVFVYMRKENYSAQACLRIVKQRFAT